MRDLVEDTKRINEKTKRSIEQARTDIRTGKFYNHNQVKKLLGLY